MPCTVILVVPSVTELVCETQKRTTKMQARAKKYNFAGEFIEDVTLGGCSCRNYTIA